MMMRETIAAADTFFAVGQFMAYRIIWAVPVDDVCV
jgi:hypothetical protein